ncbi:3'-5' exonuclease [uncultured Xanthomonas sp.]|uniref:3'-5' exonuclease n=1 Tax=uncultured Xanthomonas sp. TaxID=152831 RepID=UPI0025ED9C78|nr:3'-5' exonuclease [uncultured Xanthomonas sp.]
MTTYKVILFKPFHSAIHKLMGLGHKKIVQAVRAAMSEASTDGTISLPRTKHGETRLPNIEKYDLPEGFRLVVQLIDGVAKTRVFLYVGTHDDAQRWLDTHKNYRWVQGRNDRALDFVLVSPPQETPHIPVDMLNFELSQEDRTKPLLYRLSSDDWKSLSLPSEAVSLIEKINSDAFEMDADSVLENLTKVTSYEKASLIFDLMWHAHMNEWTQLRHRLSLTKNEAVVVQDKEAAVEMQARENSEAFITFDDTGLWDELFNRGTLAEWMLYLHPEQKQVVERELRGPARLRGVSGSGKTCVLVHRARNLVKKYRQPILIVTLTESMRKLLERLRDDLCGVEASLISVRTMSMLAKDVLSDTVRRISSSNGRLQAEAIDVALKAAEAAARRHLEFPRSIFRSMTHGQLISYLRDEMSYVRGRIVTGDLEKYLDTKLFQRLGRGTPLSQMERRIVLVATQAYLSSMATLDSHDHEMLVSLAIDSAQNDTYVTGKFRSVLSDEVQDLSELDLTLMSLLRTPSGERISKVVDGLFLAGDGAQSIYKRGFVLRRIGIDIVGRSFNLKKNYRNTHEILKAAFSLVSQFEFADVDDETLARPSMPDFAESHGRRPLILRCNSNEEEVNYIADEIYSSLAMGQSPGQVCVIAPTSSMRNSIEEALRRRGVSTAELRNDVDYESDNVKISTIESAKGHEFSAVYIMGLIEGFLPSSGIDSETLPREASRLYVAMTRAREKLFMSYSPRAGQTASRFLTAIQEDCDEAMLRNGELRIIN